MIRLNIISILFCLYLYLCCVNFFCVAHVAPIFIYPYEFLAVFLILFQRSKSHNVSQHPLYHKHKVITNKNYKKRPKEKYILQQKKNTVTKAYFSCVLTLDGPAWPAAIKNTLAKNFEGFQYQCLLI